MPNKHQLEIEIKATDAASGPMSKIEANATKLGERLKRIGEASGNEAFGKLGSVFGKADSAGGGLFGTTAKIGGALFIGSQIGREAQQAGDALTALSGRMDDTAITARQMFGEFARGIPFLGDQIKGFDSLREGLDNFVISVRDKGGFIGGVANTAISATNWARDFVGMEHVKRTQSPEEIAAEKAKLDERDAARRITMNIVRDAREELDPAAKIRREDQEKIAAIRRDVRDKKVLEQDAADAIAVINAQTRDKIAKLGEQRVVDTSKITADIVRIERDAADTVRGVQVSAMRRMGQDLEADFTEIAARYKAMRDDIQAERQKIIDNPTDPATDAKRRAALAAREASVNAAEGEDVTKAKAADAARREAAAEKVQRITRETIGMQIAADDEAGQKILRRLEATREVADLEKEIRDALKDPSLKDADRASLQSQLGGLKGILAAKLAGIDRPKDTGPIVTQGRQVAHAEDGRFTASSIAARSMVEVQQARHVEATAKNTGDLKDLVKQLLDELTRGPAVG